MIWERTTRYFSQEKIHEIVYQVFVEQFRAYDELSKRVINAEKHIGKPEKYLPIAREIKELLDQ